MKKYELVDYNEITRLHRVKALKDFGSVKVGDIGGWIEKEENLSHSGNAWVYGDASVSGDASVYGNAWVSGNACVSGNADYIVFKNSLTSGRYFTYTKSNDSWKIGCFYGTTEELEKHLKENGSELQKLEYGLYIELVKKLNKN